MEPILRQPFPLWPAQHDELCGYLLKNYQRLLTPGERTAWHFINISTYVAHKPEAESYLRVKQRIMNWDGYPDAARLLAQGEAAFYDAVKARLLVQCPEVVVINRCPKCQALCRTPTACLCPNPKCNHSWYEKRGR
jgi:hypothetical protein